MKVMVRMVVLVLLKASWPPILLVSASCTGSCRYHQSRALSCSCNSGNQKFLQRCSRQCSSLSFESQNTCQALLTAVDSLLECFERSEFRPRCCSASMCQEHPCCKGRDHQCRACSRHSNRTGRRNCPLDNSCWCCSGAQLCSHLCNPCFGWLLSCSSPVCSVQPHMTSLCNQNLNSGWRILSWSLSNLMYGRLKVGQRGPDLQKAKPRCAESCRSSWQHKESVSPRSKHWEASRFLEHIGTSPSRAPCEEPKKIWGFGWVRASRTCTLRLCSGNKTSWGFRGFSFWIRFRVEESCYSRGQGITCAGQRMRQCCCELLFFGISCESFPRCTLSAWLATLHNKDLRNKEGEDFWFKVLVYTSQHQIEIESSSWCLLLGFSNMSSEMSN